MATSRFNVCGDCGDRKWVPRLFDALRSCAVGSIDRCPKCGCRTHLELKFPFGLGAGEHSVKVLHAFLPDSIVDWTQPDKSNVCFYPFLVIVHSLKEGHAAVWLPYWHVVTAADGSVKCKYGQWAPFVDTVSYASMAEKARAAGYAI